MKNDTHLHAPSVQAQKRKNKMFDRYFVCVRRHCFSLFLSHLSRHYQRRIPARTSFPFLPQYSNEEEGEEEEEERTNAALTPSVDDVFTSSSPPPTTATFYPPCTECTAIHVN